MIIKNDLSYHNFNKHLDYPNLSSDEILYLYWSIIQFLIVLIIVVTLFDKQYLYDQFP